MKTPAVVVLAVLACLFSGCAWNPNMASRTYEGVVINEPRHRPETGARVTAWRAEGGLLNALTPSRPVGSVWTDQAGRFRLVTSVGGAQSLSVSTRDGLLNGQKKLRFWHSRRGLVLKIRPALTQASFQSPIDPESPEAKALRNAVNRILYDYVSSGDKQPRSLEAYARLGVISKEELAAFQNAPYCFGPQPKVRFLWERQEVKFSSIDAPVNIVPIGPLDYRFFAPPGPQ